MKALSLTQPWAFAVVHVGKTIENRRWNTSFRGEFLIHAAKGMTRDGYEDALDFCAEALGLIDHRAIRPPVPSYATIERGGIVGVARLVSVTPPCVTRAPSLFTQPCEHRWHMPEQFGFMLEDVRPLPFTPCKGALGFWEVPAGIVGVLGLRVR